MKIIVFIGYDFADPDFGFKILCKENVNYSKLLNFAWTRMTSRVSPQMLSPTA